MNKVIILSGVSGSGKSFLAKKLLKEDGGGDGLIVSADSYFTSPSGEYNFDPKKLSLAHQACFRSFLHAIQHELSSLILVDNTNCNAWEIAPFILAAESFNYSAEIQTIRCADLNDVELCVQRNMHKVPKAVIMQQDKNLRLRYLPPFWKNTESRMGR